TLNPPGCNCSSSQQAGTLDLSFDPGSGANSVINAIASQADNKIIIGGNFSTYQGVPRKYIARLNTDGTLDASFDPGIGPNGEVMAIVIQNDGKIIIGGNFIKYNNSDNWGLIRLNSNGTVDQSFFNEVMGPSPVNAIAVQKDGKILAGGYFSYPNANNTNASKLIRLNNNGTLDILFNPLINANDQITAIAVQDDGKIIIGGEFSTVNGIGKDYLARLDANGFFDPSFNPGGNGPDDIVQTIMLQSDGKILISGFFSRYNNISKNGIVRLNSNGTIDPSFNPGSGFDQEVYASLIQCDGKIMAGGGFSSYNGVTMNGIARLNQDGSL